MIQNTWPLITADEIEKCFTDNQLLEKKSFFIIETDKKGYNTNRNPGTYIEEIQTIKNAYNDGFTIVVKNMENYNEAIRKKAAEYGRDVDVCMFLSPREGSSFGWHKDEEDVYVHLVSGKKVFFVEYPFGEHQASSIIERHILVPGDVLHIPPGYSHCAFTLGSSIHLSFGVKQYPYYHLAGGLTKEELGLV